MQWKDLSNLIAEGAPLVGGLVGGPMGATMGKMLASTLGVKEDPSAIAEALKNDPEAVTKIRTLELNNELELQRMTLTAETERMSINAADRDSARKREVDTGDNTPKILAYAVTAGFFAVLTGVGAFGIPESGEAVMQIMIGALGNAWAGVIGYYYGTTKSSAVKTQIIASK